MNQDIQILRGVAIAMVLVAHLPINLLTWPDRLYRFATAWWQGATGVDLFFAISGFVIARTLLPQIAAAGQGAATRAILRFWVRRAFRLLPAAWLWLGIALTVSAWLGKTSAFGDTHANLYVAIAAAANVANLYLLWAPPDWPPPPTEIYWSLSLEEQFYAVLPVAALLCGAALPWLMGCVLAYQLVMPMTLLTDITRPGALAAGVLLAIASQQSWYGRLRPRLLERYAAARALLIGAGVGGMGAVGLAWGSTHLTAAALIAAVLVFAASFDGFCVWPERRSGRLLAWLGSRSYAVYVSHMIFFRGVRQVMLHLYGPTPPHLVWLDAAQVAAGLGATLLAAELTFVGVEQPFRRLGRRLAGPTTQTRHATGAPA